MEFRTERDPLDEVKVPADAYYGAQTMRAVENFPTSGLRLLPVDEIDAILSVDAMKRGEIVGKGKAGKVRRS